MHKYSEYILLGLLTLCVFFITLNFNYQGDTYYHIKAGETFIQKGILLHEVFSNSAYGRLFYPYEWLFQIGIYYFQLLFGIKMIAIGVSIVSVAQILVLYYFLKRFFSIPSYFLAIISFIYSVGMAPFLIARPQLFASFNFMISAFIVLLYFVKNKNYLWLLVPLVLLWINFHSTVIIMFLFIGYYAILAFVLYLLSKNRLWLSKAKVLLAYTVGFILLSFTPPLFGIQYKLLLLYAKYQDSVQTIGEWLPLSTHVQQFVSYSIILGIIGIFCLFIKKHITRQVGLLAIPLVVMAFSPYLLIRYLPFGWFAIILIMSFSVAKGLHLKHKYLFLSVYFVMILIAQSFYYGKLTIPILDNNGAIHNPEQAASFILNNHLKGNMFNTLNYGMYLVYRLYPEQRVFIDGHIEPYLCCEIPEQAVLDNTTMSPNRYNRLFLNNLNKHKISFVVATRDNTAQYQINFLAHNPTWSLVFWDDNAQIFVRRNDLNNSIITQFGAIAARPDDASLYDPQHVTEAIAEYNRMIGVADSAKSRNILGVIYLRHNDARLAQDEFEKAIQADSTYAPPYVNLAYIAVKQGDYQQAITEYERAIKQGSTDPVPFITLGELYIKVDNDTSKAKAIWQQGLQKVSNTNGKIKLTQLLNTY